MLPRGHRIRLSKDVHGIGSRSRCRSHTDRSDQGLASRPAEARLFRVAYLAGSSCASKASRRALLIVMKCPSTLLLRRLVENVATSVVGIASSTLDDANSRNGTEWRRQRQPTSEGLPGLTPEAEADHASGELVARASALCRVAPVRPARAGAVAGPASTGTGPADRRATDHRAPSVREGAARRRRRDCRGSLPSGGLR